MSQPRTPCRTPNAEGVTNIPTWKFDTARAAILAAIDAAGPDGLAFKDLCPEVAARLDEETKTRFGSISWHTVCVKLEMEVSGQIIRVAGKSPQRLKRTPSL
jgi:hypothetical protein